MSPHPVDMMKGSAVAAADITELQQKDRRIVGSPAPHFTLDGALGSSESAEELRRLIESMETEFRRLRQSKLQAEDKAAKLATELNIQQQMMEKRFESLYMENEQLKSALSVSLTKLACVMEKLNQSAAFTWRASEEEFEESCN
jgi:DNA repair exonuclease SbcCD ATPase subunit